MNRIVIFALAACLSVVPFAPGDDVTNPMPAKAVSSVPQNFEPQKPTMVTQQLQDVSATILSVSKQGRGEGSGVFKTRKMEGGETAVFVWTAAHNVDNLRHTKSVLDTKSGSSKMVVEFDDAMVIKVKNQKGRLVSKTEYYAEVIRYSAEEDLALLRIRETGFTDKSVEFHLADDIPAIGSKLLHVGSLLGQVGSNSMTSGIVSQHGRMIDKKVFDQTTVSAFPGSSGGGVFTEDGKMVGLVLRGAGETFNLIVPVRRVRSWARRAGVEWALDDKIPMPTEEQLLKMPVEDNGVEFSFARRTDDGKALPGTPAISAIIVGRGNPHLGSEEMELRYPTLQHWTPAAK